jgi:hypothetical protein
MELIILNEGLYQLIPVTKQMMDGIVLTSDVDCFELCDILRLKLTTFVDSLNRYVMNDDSGYFFGCMCN